MTTMFFVNTQTQRRFQIMDVDPTAGKITLRGETAEFTTDYNKEEFKRMGYKLVTEEGPTLPEQERIPPGTPGEETPAEEFDGEPDDSEDEDEDGEEDEEDDA